MGTKGYRNTAKTGAKAASARRRQAVAKARTRKKPKLSGAPRKPRIEVVSENDLDGSQPQDSQLEADVRSPENLE